ncbi:hypothetical protein ACFC26_07735 [Kitasatospora purpeofusca]|uniref:hypothetical protein n=1 Tax=Kitasatospora purpeofusca TaxID=67352 RepID=UPI0035E01560
MSPDDMDDLLERMKASPEELRQTFHDIDKARRGAEAVPVLEPNITPEPDLIRAVGPAFRFHCPLSCGWFHDEPLDTPGDPTRIILPAAFSLEDLDGALTLNAEAAGLAFRTRVEDAVTGHYASQHPEH